RRRGAGAGDELGSGVCAPGDARAHRRASRVHHALWRRLAGGEELEVGPVVLCLNRGSSSLKFALYRFGDDEQLAANGEVDRIGLDGGRIKVHDAHGKLLKYAAQRASDHDEIIGAIFALIDEYNLPRPVAVGHRVVHGGPSHFAPERITSALIDALRT